MRSLALLATLTSFAVATGAQPRILDLGSAGTGLRHAVIMVRAPQAMNERELGAYQILSTSLFDKSADFIRGDLLSTLITAGLTPRFWWSQDMIMIQCGANPGSEPAVARIIESLVTSHQLTEEQFTKASESLRTSRADDFSVALMGWRGDFGTSAEYVNNFAQTLFRPETVTIATSTEMRKSIESRFADWQTPRVQRDVRSGRKGVFRGPETAIVTRWSGATFVPTSSAAGKILAMVGFGAGKTGLLFQVVREELRASYRQEAIMFPTATGVKPLVVFSGSNPLPDQAGKALKARVDLYNAEDLRRIQTLARAGWEGRIPLHPFWSTGYGPKGTSEMDTIAMRSLFGFWGLDPSAWDSLPEELNRVTLEELKSASTDLLKEMTNIEDK